MSTNQTATNIEDVYPLSPLQQGMLFQTLLHEGSGVYLMQDRYQMSGQINVDAFLEAWRMVIKMHPALRASFVWKTKEQPLQAIHKQVKDSVEFIDISDLSPEQREGYIQNIFKEEQRVGFNLAKPPLIRVRLVKLAENSYELVRSFHHILMDAWCISLVMVDFINIYDALRQGNEPVLRQSRPFRDYIAWLKNRDYSKDEQFWKIQLQGLDTPTPLVIEQSTRRNQYSDAVLVEDTLIHLSAGQTKTLTRFCQSSRITPNTLFQGAWGILLARYTSNSDVLFGVTVAGRPPELHGVEEMVGLFINTLPLRISVDEDASLVPWLQSLQLRNLELREFEHSALVDIQGWSDFPRGQELFDSILVYENAPMDTKLISGDMISFSLDNMDHSVHTHYGLTVVILPGEELGIRISYDHQRFNRFSIDRLLGHLRQLVVQMLDQPAAKLGSLDLLTSDEHQQLLAWNETAHDFPLNQTYAQLFARQVKQRPKKMAAVCGAERLTYAELDARSSRLAKVLIDSGIGPDVIVAVLAERGLGFLTSVIAIFKAGAAYLPLEVKHPVQRLIEILSLSKAPVLMISPAQAELASEICGQLPQPPRVVNTDTVWCAGIVPTIEFRGAPDNLAYVIFTSGSTGVPKGALVEQRGMLNNIFGKVPALGLGEADRIAQTASVAFDISVWQLLAAPVTGGTVYILPDSASQDPAQLLAAVEANQLTLLEAVPVVIRGLLTASSSAATLSSLRWLLPTGEALPPTLCREWFTRFPAIPLMNAYGPAECSDDVAFYPITLPSDLSLQAMPIGRPTANNQLFILDDALRQAPVGIPGEICVAGVGVGRGYLSVELHSGNDPERTRATFIENPFERGARFYRTGDLGRFRADGVIEFLGRRDHQVKILGHRIELGEIESRLQQHPGVSAAAIVAKPGAHGDLHLVGYWVAKTNQAATADELREYLASQLPTHMVPAVLVELEQLPLSTNGKVDRKQLAKRELDTATTERTLIAPATETESLLYKIWKEILAAEEFSTTDSFFSLGGHSLLATQVISRIRLAVGIELPLKALFEHPTVALLAKLVDASKAVGANNTPGKAAPVLPLVNRKPYPAKIPLSFAQQRLWFIEQLNPDTSHFNVSLALRLQGELRVDALEQSFRLLIARHDVLRTAFVSENGTPEQQVLDAVHFDLPVSEHPLFATVSAQGITIYLREWLEQPFNLANPPLLRARLLRVSANEHILAVSLHHLVSDAWSATIAMRELAGFYTALHAGQQPAVSKLPIQYADFALWQREYMQGDVLKEQLAYWTKAVATSDGETSDYLLALPTDKQRPAVQSYKSGSLVSRLSEGLSDQIRAYAQKQGQSPFSLVMAAFTVLLHRMVGQNDIILGTPVSNRSQVETESLLGILLNNLPIRADFSNQPDFSTLARQVSDSLHEAQQNQDLPFEQLVDHLALPRSLSHAPLFQVMVAQQLTVESRVQFPGLTYDVLDTKLTHSEYDLDLHIVTPATGAIELEIMYSLDLFEPATANRWMERFELLIGRLLESPNLPVAQLPLLTPAEFQQTVIDWNRTGLEFPRHLALHQLFEEQVARTPDEVAVVFEGKELSYAQLNACANQLAYHLRSLDIGPNQFVALCIDRSLDMFIGMLGILKSGGAYVPLDPALPCGRLADMVADSKPLALVTQQSLVDVLPDFAGPSFCIDSDWADIAGHPIDNLPNLTKPEDSAYVIYTSGSTGKPKGTHIYHRSVVNLAWARLEGIYRPLGLGHMRSSFNYSFAFDASVAEFIMLLDGHTLYLTPEDIRFSPPDLVRYFKEIRLDSFECTPAQLKYLIETGETEHLPRFVLFGGDAIDPHMWQLLQEIPDKGFFNTYGPTECTVDAIACRIEPSLTKPVIGRPIANMRAYILDTHLNPMPVGVAGELHLGGEGVSYGYLNREELTAEKFITDPFNPVPGARMYKSGDLARFLADGTIEYLGRLDHQVKIRGFRVELGEVEAALTAQPSVRQAVVVVREDRPGDRRLVAYLIPEGADLDENLIRTALKQHLPDYMIPNHLVVLEKLPLTGNGKIDRKALPKPDYVANEVHLPPETPGEKLMATLWAEVLGMPVERIGRDANFFHLGGHSLLTTVLSARIAKHFTHAPTLRQLFEQPSVSGLCRLVGDIRLKSHQVPSTTNHIPERSRPDRLPLSYEQQRLWFLEQLSPGTGEYNITTALEIVGQLQLDNLRDAFKHVINRHEILRSRIRQQVLGEELIIDEASQFELVIESVEITASAWPGFIYKAAEQEAAKGFALTSEHPIRARLLRTSSSENHLLLATLHHTVADDWSIQVLMTELTQAYKALSQHSELKLPLLPIQYPDYSLWQRSPERQAVYCKQLEYWRANLGNEDYLLDLPTDFPRRTQANPAAGSCFAQLPSSLTTRLRDYAKQQGVTTYMLLLASLKLLLGRYANQTDVRIGTPVGNRQSSDVQPLIGCFVNTLVIRSELNAENAFTDYVQQIKHQVLSAQEHQDVPFDQLVEALAPERDLSRTPLFQVLFAMQSTDAKAMDWGDLNVRELTFAPPAAKFDMNWEVHDDQERLLVMLEYRTSLYTPETMERWLAEWQMLLDQILANPQQKLVAFTPLSTADRNRQLVDWQATDKEFTGPETLSEALAKQAQLTPSAPALVFESASLSYQELHLRANQLANALLAEGIGRETVVGVCMTRSVEMVVALLGIVKAGAAYLPLDPELPAARLAFMLQDAGARLVLTQSQWQQLLPATVGSWSLDQVFPHSVSDAEPGLINQPEDMAYIIYTSGSTGQPKGVINEQGALMNRLHWMQDAFPITAADRILQKTPYSFDVSVWEFFWPLITGACLVVAKPGGHQDSGYLVELIRKERITTLHFVPSMLQAFVTEPDLAECASIRQVFASGEALPLELQQRFIARHPAALVNLYGPTEAAIDVSWWRCDATSSLSVVPIGKPIANTQLYVLGKDLEPLPLGAAGELFIGGKGLARGYPNRPELTAEKFINNPFRSGERLYRTGDSCRFLADGTIQYLSRIDHQIKLRGMRIELGEIDAALLTQTDVREAVTVLRQDLSPPQLVSYVVGEAHLAANQLKAALAKTLPAYMVPAIIVELAKFPLNANGKLDIKQLPKPDLDSDEAYVAPATNTERKVAELWANVLDLPLESIGRTSHFFHLGGNSLAATLLLARIRQEFSAPPSLRQLFERPVLAAFAALCNGAKVDAELTIKPQARPEKLPLSFAQQRLWFLEQLDQNVAEYNITSAIEFSGPLNPNLLKQSLEHIVARHEILRAHMVEVGTGAELVINCDSQIPLPLETVVADIDSWETLIQLAAKEEAAKPFDLARDRLIRARILSRANSSQSLLLLTLHHTVADDWSMQILIDELAASYYAFSRQAVPELVSLPIQYVDYSLWQRQPVQQENYRNQLVYWRETLGDGDYVLDLPTDHARGKNMDTASGFQQFTLPQVLVNKLREYAKEQDVTVYVLLLAATQLLLGRLANQRDVRIGTPIANRSLAETQGLIGCFLNTLVIRAELDVQQQFSAFLTQVKQRVLDAQDHQDLPFEQLVNALTPGRDLARAPLFQVLFTLQNARIKDAAWESLKLRDIDVPSPTSSFDVSWEVHDDDKDLSVRLTYRRSLFEVDTIARWSKAWLSLLNQVVQKNTAMAELDILTEEERHQQLSNWNATSKHYPGPHTLAEALQVQLAKSPNLPALVYESHTLTYAELHERADQLAHALRLKGVSRESIVAVSMTRSVEMVIALLAITNAGGAYLPLDPELPAARLALMIEDASPILILSQTQWISNLPEQVPVICVDQPLAEITGEAYKFNPINKPKDLAYVIYTSGSTGKPKAVLNEHGALLNRLYWMQEAFPIGSQDRVLQKTPFSFDVSVWEFFWPLITGACLVMAKPGGHQDSHYLAQLIQQQGITTLHFVPSMLQAFTNEPELEKCTSLRQVFASGEALPFELQQRFQSRHSASLINLYGPTEAAIDVSCWECQRNSSLDVVPIGKPIANTQLYILDEALQLLPVGAIGELFIGGTGLARGYLNRADLTAECFIQNPFQLDTRLYRTGDRCRFMADGNIQYLGRVDHQIKLRGLRIELGEIDAELLKQSGIREAVTVLREDLATAQLVAYVVSEQAIDSAVLKAGLARTLPAYMVPELLVQLKALPLSGNGKVDRKQLPKPDIQAQQKVWEAPSTETEKVLCELMEKLLKVEKVGVNDNFFSLGGDSILGLQLIAQARGQGIGLNPKQLFQQPTLADLARAATSVTETQSEQGELAGSLPLLPIQHWFLARNLATAGQWNQSLLTKPSALLTAEKVHEALLWLVKQHDALRLRFTQINGQWQQTYANASNAFEFTQTDVASVAEIKTAVAGINLVFDLANGPLLKAILINLKDGSQRLYFVAHHLVVDAVSWGILLEDFNRIYVQVAQGTTPAATPKTSSYRQWSKRLLQHAQNIQNQCSYWDQQKLPGIVPVDYAHADNLTADEINITEQFNAAETIEFTEAQHAYRSQGHELLLTALVLTLNDWTGSSEITIDLEGHGREAPFADLDNSRTVGWFTNLYPIRLNVPKASDPGAAIIAIKEQVRALPEHGLGYGLLRYLTEPSSNARDGNSVLFNYLGRSESGVNNDLLALVDDPLPADSAPDNIRSHELEIVASMLNGRLQVEWRFSGKRYLQQTQQQLVANYFANLRGLIKHCQETKTGQLSPADFPLAKALNQKSLDKLLSKLKPPPVSQT